MAGYQGYILPQPQPQQSKTATGDAIRGFMDTIKVIHSMERQADQDEIRKALFDLKMGEAERKKQARDAAGKVYDPVKETQKVTNPGLFSSNIQLPQKQPDVAIPYRDTGKPQNTPVGMSQDSADALNSVTGQGEQLSVPTTRQPTGTEVQKRIMDIASKDLGTAKNVAALHSSFNKLSPQEQAQLEIQKELMIDRAKMENKKELKKFEEGLSGNWTSPKIEVGENGSVYAVTTNKDDGETRTKPLNIKKGKDLSAKEKEIQRYIDLGFSKEEAVKLAEDQYKLVSTPFGTELWDKTNATIVKRSTGFGDSNGQGIAGSQSDSNQEDRDNPFISVDEAKEGTGVVSGIKQTINNVFGWAVPGQIFPDTEKARNKLKQFAQMVKPHLMVSSRGAVYEQENIERMLPSPDEFFKDPDSAKTKLQNLYSMVDASIKNTREILQKGNITQDERAKLYDDIGSWYKVLSFIPDEQALFGDQSNQLTRDNILNMNVREIKSLDLNTLTPTQRQAVQERVNQLK